MFCLTKVMPAHAKLCFTKFNFGIGCNTMEGREQKHQKVEKYQHHSTFDRRWQMAFRHEFIELIYLRENGFDKVKYSKRSRNYIPDPPPNSCESCLSTLNSSNRCVICDHKVMKEINSTLETPGWSSWTIMSGNDGFVIKGHKSKNKNTKKYSGELVMELTDAWINQ